MKEAIAARRKVLKVSVGREYIIEEVEKCEGQNIQLQLKVGMEAAKACVLLEG